MTDPRPIVLVVDDAEINIDALVETLGDEYIVRGAVDGASALRSIRKSLPDLILLDIRMPDMDGFEVCQLVQEDPTTRGIPIIFLTGLTEDVDEARGLELGAVDYITKPFNPAVVKVRVRNHLQLKAHRDRLEALVEQRTHELAEAHGRLKALDAARHEFLCVISHELRTPANGILGIAELALMGMADDSKRALYAGLLEGARQRLLATLDAALRLAELQSENASIVTVPIDLDHVLAASWDAVRDLFEARKVSWTGPGPCPVRILGNDVFVQQCVTSLLKVAREMARPSTEVTSRFEDGGHCLALVIRFVGRPLSEDLRQTFFHTFSSNRSRSAAENLGLDIPLTAHVVRAMGGSVDIDNVEGGVELRLVLLKAGLGTNG